MAVLHAIKNPVDAPAEEHTAEPLVASPDFKTVAAFPNELVIEPNPRIVVAAHCHPQLAVGIGKNFCIGIVDHIGRIFRRPHHFSSGLHEGPANRMSTVTAVNRVEIDQGFRWERYVHVLSAGIWKGSYHIPGIETNPARAFSAERRNASRRCGRPRI